MNQLVIAILLLLFVSTSYSQHNILFLKQGSRTIYRFWKGSIVAFQTQDKEWQKGEITKLTNDSVYIKPRIVRYYMMGTDTIYLPVVGFAVAEIYSLPKRGMLIDYINVRFQISRSGGHVNWFWVKSGWIFRTGGIGYASLNIINGLIDHNFSLRESRTALAISVAVWAFGVVLQKIYKPILPVGKKYHIEILKLN